MSQIHKVSGKTVLVIDDDFSEHNYRSICGSHIDMVICPTKDWHKIEATIIPCMIDKKEFGQIILI